ncbi:MAG: hypothetical protein GEU99_03195 [Luteitalea sp.]|nr:hypothetical protein [Luteitalea sp.]
MPNGNDELLKVRIEALQRNTAGLLQLLGDDDDRLRFFEVLKGITTPAVFRVLDHQLGQMETLINQVHKGAEALEYAAKEIRA